MLSLGRVTVLIGENGSGKSNILEAIAFAAGAAANKLDNEFLFNRGIRVTEKEWVTSAFPPDDSSSEKRDGAIELSVIGGLCTAVMGNIVELAAKFGKQVICTTHNPAILDGLDLQNDQQRLYAVRRDSEGRTVVRRIHAPRKRISEATKKRRKGIENAQR